MRRDAVKHLVQDPGTPILNELCDSERKITRVLPFRNPPMPSVGTRRSTRVFVPKSVVKIGAGEAEVKVLRSGKRLSSESGLKGARKCGHEVELDENVEEWFPLLENSAEALPKKEFDAGKVRFGKNSSCGRGSGRNRFDRRDDFRWWISLGRDQNRQDHSNCDLPAAVTGVANEVIRDQALPESGRKRFASAGKASFSQEENPVRRTRSNFLAAGEERIYGITYIRKRRKVPGTIVSSQSEATVSSESETVVSSQSETNAAKDKKYGISFVRRLRRKTSGKTGNANEAVHEELKSVPSEISRETEILQRISLNDIDNGCLSMQTLQEGTAMVSPPPPCSLETPSFTENVALSNLAAIRDISRADFLARTVNQSIAGVFSQHGIHFLPLRSSMDLDKMVCLLKECPISASSGERAVNATYVGDAQIWCSKPNLPSDGTFPRDIFSVVAPLYLNGPGVGVIFGARRHIPLVSLNFSAIPSYFMSLYSRMFFRFQYSLNIFERYSRMHANEHGDIGREEHHSSYSSSGPLLEERRNLESSCQESCIPTRKSLSAREFTDSGLPAGKKVGLTVDVPGITTRPDTRNIAVRHASKVRKHQKKRRTWRSVRGPGPSLMDGVCSIASEDGRPASVSSDMQNGHFTDRQSGFSFSENNGLTETSFPQINGVESGRRDSCNFSGRLAISGSRGRLFLSKLNSSCKVSHSYDRSPETCFSDLLDIRVDAAGAYLDSNNKLRKSMRKSNSEKFKEMKSALVDLKQNIDSVRCSANILVIGSDRCWRECGAEVMLEFSGSNDWWLAVKTQDATRYLHKAQEMRPSVSNRYTHAMMWTGENGWKLEFCDRKDWIVFKELHRECCERNLQAASVRVIPVPGVREVWDYDCDYCVAFVRPDMYITSADDEVGRALMSESVNYDMDSGDEVWFKQLNTKSHDAEHDGLDRVSEENFEKIIYTLEKAAYSHPDDVLDEDRAFSLCIGLGQKNLIAAVYEYWLRKRKQKRKALVRVFQGPPPKRARLIEKPFLRKKRSFKRHGIQIKKGKPEKFLEEGAQQEALRKVQEAQSAATKALEWAVMKRRRSQILMQNADMMTYKSLMALKLAEAVDKTEAFDAFSLILD